MIVNKIETKPFSEYSIELHINKTPVGVFITYDEKVVKLFVRMVKIWRGFKNLELVTKKGKEK